MKQKPNKTEERLEQLLIQKDFETLSDPEKEFVLQHLSHEEYLGYRTLLRNVKLLFEEDRIELELDDQIRTRILNAMSRKHIKAPLYQNIFIRAMSIRIPVYQATAIFAVAFLFMLFDFGKVQEPVTETKTVYLYKTDTVYVQRARTDLKQSRSSLTKKESGIYKRIQAPNSGAEEKISSGRSYQETNSNQNFDSYPIIANETSYDNLNLKDLEYQNQQSVGRTMKEDSLITRFLVSAY